MTDRHHIGIVAARREPEGGVALLLALLFVVLLSAIVVEYAYENRVESSFVENAANDFEAEVAAKSAVASGLSLLAADLSLEQMALEGLSDLPINPQTGQAEQVDSLQDAWAMGIPYRNLNRAAMQCLISDEYGKININALVPPETYRILMDDGNSPGADPQPEPMPVEEDLTLQDIVRALFQLRGADDDPTDAIMDWIDPDDETRPNGAESDYYSGLEVPFACKNAPMDSVEELLLIKGVTPEIFFGDPSKDQLPMTELFTVHGEPRGRINPNTAPWEVLDAIGEALGRQSNLAQRILEERESAPITNDEYAQSLGIMQPVAPDERPRREDGGDPQQRQQTLREKPFVYASNSFRIRGSGECGDAGVMIEVFVWRMDSATYASLIGTSDRISTGFNIDRLSRRNRGGRERNRGNSLTGVQGAGPELGPQVFRILDWRVIR